MCVTEICGLLTQFGMNNPYLLKNQLKENEEELSNYLRDMKIWHEQMKRKEQSPPVKVPFLKTKLLIFKFNFHHKIDY